MNKPNNSSGSGRRGAGRTLSRRTLLATGVAAAAGTAGCLGNGDDPSSSPDQNDTEDDENSNNGTQESDTPQLIEGRSVQQLDSAPGVIEARLEASNDAEGLENLSEEVLEAQAEVNGDTQEVTMEAEYGEDGQFEGYSTRINIFENGEITDDVQLNVTQIPEIEDFEVTKENLQIDNIGNEVDPGKFISARQAYMQGVGQPQNPVSPEDFEHFENGQPTDLGQLIKETNIHAIATENGVAEDYKAILHNVLDIPYEDENGETEVRVADREGTADSAYVAVFFNNQGWKKALVRPQANERVADEAVLLPDAEKPGRDAFSARRFLHGYHNPDDEYERTPLDFVQNVQTIEEYDTKEKKTEEEWEDYNEEFDEFNDLLIPGGMPNNSGIGYTEDVRGYMQDIIHPRNGDTNKEVELIEAASEYARNAVPQGMYMEIDVAETVEEGEELIELDDGNTMFATTVDEETHEENVMELYDPDVPS